MAFKITEADFEKVYGKKSNTQKQASAPAQSVPGIKITEADFDKVYGAERQRAAQQQAQTAGVNTPAVSYAEKVTGQAQPEVNNKPAQKYGLIDGKVVLPSSVENQGLRYAPGSKKNVIGAFGEGVTEGLESAFSNFANTSDTIKSYTAMPGHVHNQLKNVMYDAGKAPIVADIVKDNQQKYGVGSQYYKDIQKGIVDRNQKQATDIVELYKKYADMPYAETAIKAGQGVGAMLPAILAGAAGGRFMRNGLSGTLTEEAKKKAIQYAADMASKPVFAANVFGGAKAEALASGASENQAEGYAMADTALELGIEALFGGIPMLGGGKISAKGLTEKYIKTAAGQFLVNRLVDITGEGIEEVVSGIIEPFLKRAFYDKDAKNASLKELASVFGNGALVSAILGMANIGGNVAEYNEIKQNIGKTEAKPDQAGVVTLPAPQVQTVTDTNVGNIVPQTEQAVPQADDTGVVTLPAPQADMETVLPAQQTEQQVAKDIDVPDKPFDISTLPQVEKKATPAVSRLKEYISTLPETQGKNAEINLNKKHNGSDMTVAQFVESNADASFYKEGKLYYMEKDGKKLPVKKSMYDYAKYLQSAADTDVGTTETVEEKPTVDTTGYGNAKVIGKKGNVDILDSIPEGWKRFDMQTAPVGYEGVTNGESLFGGKRKHALVARETVNKKPQLTKEQAKLINRWRNNVEVKSVGITADGEAQVELNIDGYKVEYSIKPNGAYTDEFDRSKDVVDISREEITKANTQDVSIERLGGSADRGIGTREGSGVNVADYFNIERVQEDTPQAETAEQQREEFEEQVREKKAGKSEIIKKPKNNAERMTNALLTQDFELTADNKTVKGFAPYQRQQIADELLAGVKTDRARINIDVENDGQLSIVNSEKAVGSVLDNLGFKAPESAVDKALRTYFKKSDKLKFANIDDKVFLTNGYVGYIVNGNISEETRTALNEAGYEFDEADLRKVVQLTEQDNFNLDMEPRISTIKDNERYIFDIGNGKYAAFNKKWFDSLNKNGNKFVTTVKTTNENYLISPLKVVDANGELVGVLMPMRSPDAKTKYEYGKPAKKNFFSKTAKTSANNSQNIEKTSENSYNVNKEGDNNGEENNVSGAVQQNQRKVRTGAEIRTDGRGRAESQSSNRGIGENRKLPEENRRERIGQGKGCVYYVISKNEYSQIANETIKEMAKLGIKPDVYGGDMLVNGKPRGKKADATTFDDGTVAVNNNATQVPPKESAGHEAVHHYLATGNEAAIEYKRVFDENFEVLSDAAVDLTELIQKEYSGDLTEEYPSIYSGWLYDNFDEGLAYYNGCFTNETAVREAHQKFIDAITVKQNTKTKGTSKDVSVSLPENEKAEKKAKPKKEKAAENKLTDFGEKIGGARKDDWRDRGLDVNDIAGMTDKEKAKFITKDNIWKKPNYEALIKEGKDKNVTYFLKTVRDGLPTKPEFRTTNKELARQVQEEYVKQMREFTDLVMSLDTKEKVMNAFDEVLVKGGYITKDSSRLYAPWHPTEKGKHIFTEKLFNAFRNAEGVNGWRYLSNKVQKDQFGVPSSEKIPKGYSLTEFDDGWAVLKGYKVISKEFATRESALSWLKENTKRTKNNRFVPPSVERVRREGVDVRKGAEVTGEKLMEAYGFRGGEFGNWTNQKERQMNLNFAFDAFHDLARTLGISEKDVSLDGKLAIAFGARGRGGANAAAAHYEPTLEVINLTRMKGAGTLGHEWAHALDDIIGEKAIGKAFTKSRGAYQAYDNLLETMKWRDATAEEVAQMNQATKDRNIKSATSWLNNVFTKYTMDKMTDSQKAEFENLKAAFLSGEKGSVDKLNDLHKEATGRVIPSGTRNTLTTFERIWLVSDSNNRISARVPTNFMEGSKYFDKFENRSETYWASDVEMFARAFHTYLLDKTEGKSDYLNASAEWHALPDLETGKIYRAYPYGKERITINKAFEEFINALKKDGYLTTQEYDAGEMISYSTDGAKVTMEGKIVIEPKKEKAPESPHKLVPEKFAKEQAKKAGNDLPESVGAMKSGYYAAIEEYGAFPEGEKVTNPVDVPMSVDGVHGVTRGVRTIMEAAATKEDMLSDYETAVANGEFNYDINRDKDAVEKAVAYIEKYGFRNTYNEWRKKVDNKQTITKDDMTQAQIMYASAVAEGDYDIAMKLATDIAVQATKAGQVVQSMRILKKTTPEGRLYYAQKSVEAIQDDVNEKYGDKSPKLEVPQELLDNLKKAKTDEEIRKATAEINQAIADQLPFSWSNFINSWRYLAMLGNTRTQVRNIASNIIGTVAQEYTNFVQTGIEKALSGKGVEKTSAVKTTEWQRKQAEEDYKAVRETLHGAGKYRNDSLQGIQKLQNPFDFKGKGGKAGKIAGDVLTKWNEMTNWAMDEGDKLFSRPAYLRYYARYLSANNITSEKQLTSKVKLRARAWATKQAKEAVYREENALAKWISGMEKDLAQSNKATVRTGAKIVGGIMPFRGTPLNITKRAFEYTPVGIATELINNKNSNPVETINKAAKSLSGTSLIVLGYALAKSGILTGGLGDDKEDKMKEHMGQQPYSVNVGNYSYTLDWGGAGIMPLFIGAEMYNSTAEDSENFLMALMDTFANASAPVMETSMMTGLMDALKTASYEDNMAESITSFLSSGLSSYIGQFVPTILGQVARAVDDTSRSSYTNVKGVMKPLAKTVQKMENKIPLLSKTNVPYMDVWGKEVKNFGGSFPGRLAYNMLSPGYAEKKSTDNVEKMLYDLYDKTGDKEVLPKNYTTSSKKNGVTTRFTPAQFEKYTKVYGQTAYNLIEELYSDNLYKNRSNEEKAGYIKKAYEAALKTAQTSVVNYKHDNSTTKRMNALNEGIPMSLVYASLVLEKKMDTDNSNGINQAEAKAYIDKYGADLSDAQKAKLFSIYSPTTKNNPYE